VAQTGTKQQTVIAPQVPVEEMSAGELRASGTGGQWIEPLRILWGKRILVGRAVLAGLLFGTLLAFLLPTRYESSTQLMPPDNQSGSGVAMLAALTAKTGGGLGGYAGDLLGVKSSGALFIGILRSWTVEDRLAKRFDLKKVYGVRLQVDAHRELEENTAISEDRKSGIITITVSDRDPQRAATLGQAYVEELDRLVAGLSTSAAHRERVFLEGRLRAVKLELDQASQQFSQFASKNTAIDIKEQGRAMMDAAATLMGQLIAAESEQKGLEELYTPNNVRVRAVQARITELRRQLEKMGGKTTNEPSDAGATGDSLYPSIRKLPLLGVTYGDLYRQTKIQEVVYETLTQQYELAKVQEAKETPSVKVLDPARVPERKSFPPRLLIMFLCTFLAMAGSAVWVLGRERWEETDPKNPGKALATDVFQTLNAKMPWAPPNGSRLQTMTHRIWMKLARQSRSTEDVGLPPN
jgi:uncharacterized protein involved in exopolysaccharide biosynthesis